MAECAAGLDVESHFPSLRPLWDRIAAPRGVYIRAARTSDQYGVIDKLLRRMYAWRGYRSEPAARGDDDPDWVTLAAWRFDEPVATLSIARDSSKGLLTDAIYQAELAALRGPDRLICEVSRFAVDPDFSSPDLLSSLFDSATHYARDVFAASDVVIEVNPRHSRYYERRFGFRQIGGQRLCPRVGAPAVLLHKALRARTPAAPERQAQPMPRRLAGAVSDPCYA